MSETNRNNPITFRLIHRAGKVNKKQLRGCMNMQSRTEFSRLIQPMCETDAGFSEEYRTYYPRWDIPIALATRILQFVYPNCVIIFE